MSSIVSTALFRLLCQLVHRYAKVLSNFCNGVNAGC
nr:MAG TPA: hypothetical protein [Caudoviricetes sp.]